ncbi:hypothetical protein MRS76_07730 [Rhizobiaceae bacterium n13]|uniref:Uncharacterized protein n=1 Tax=Ferirhizobium litorale TaxID=2927786 RepID=A0AAE3QET0_9HYPH|nr:hypothetical protein [Fererhizobium litorale]MDI7861845.1 hypothetical protein [Fererhizobium litorale]MDI7921813.1 hypothetical protein [Fererhizobium litorale]
MKRRFAFCGLIAPAKDLAVRTWAPFLNMKENRMGRYDSKVVALDALDEHAMKSPAIGEKPPIMIKDQRTGADRNG